MTKNNEIRIHRIFGILLSVSIFIAGICLIYGCISIYLSGDQPYSRQAVADTFETIAVPIYLCLTLTLIGFVLNFVLPSEPKKQKNAKHYTLVLDRMLAAKDTDALSGENYDSVRKERERRKLHWIIALSLCFIASVVFTAYAINPNNYGSDINSSVIKAMWVLIPCFAVAFGYTVFAVYYSDRSIRREIEIIKTLPNAPHPKDSESKAERSFKTELTILRIALISVGVGILIYGFISGGTADVLTKAINICTECIGLG